MFATFKGKERKREVYLIPDGSLRGYNQNYETNIHSPESHLYRKDKIATITHEFQIENIYCQHIMKEIDLD